MSTHGIELVLVDFDDTLVDTAPRFQNARRSLFSFLVELGVAEHAAAQAHHDRIDQQLLEVHGLGPFRLEHSFRATYREVCREHGLSEDATVAEQCAAFGRAVAGTPPLFDGALAALECLCGRFQTVIYTQASDPEYQMGCVRDTGVLATVGPGAVHICRRKTVASFLETTALFGVQDPARVWMVGNSIRSDLNPALEAGARAILVEEVEPWSFDQVEPFSDAYVALPSFAAAVDHLIGLDPVYGR